MDIDNIQLGIDIRTYVESLVRESDVLLAVIGKSWLSSTDQSGRQRILNSADFVRMEIAIALKTGTTVVPILFDHSSMPLPDDLPEDIRGLAFLNAFRIRQDSQYQSDVKRLILGIKKSVNNESIWSESVLSNNEEYFTESLSSLVFQFLETTKRKTESIHEYVFRIPEIFAIAETELVTARDLSKFEKYFSKGEVAFFAFRGELLPGVIDLIADLRARGYLIVPISDAQMMTSLADGITDGMLSDLVRSNTGDNPFQLSNAINEPSQFFGRELLLPKIGGLLANGEHVLLTGTRKSGKSSFLNMLRQRLIDVHPVAWVDLQFLDRNDSNWPSKLFAQIIGSFDGWGKSRFKSDWPFTEEVYNGGVEFAKALSARQEWAYSKGINKRWLLVLDELERLFPALDDGKLSAQFIVAAGALRATGQGANQMLSIIVADLRPTANRVNQVVSGTNPFFDFFSEISLPNLTQSEVEEMVTIIGRRLGLLRVRKSFISELYTHSGGHARLTRMLAAAAVDIRVDAGKLSKKDLFHGIESLDLNGKLHNFLQQNFWEPLTDKEKECLVSSAVSAQASHDFWRPFSKARSNAKNSSVAGSLNLLGLLNGNTLAATTFERWILDQNWERTQ